MKYENSIESFKEYIKIEIKENKEERKTEKDVNMQNAIGVENYFLEKCIEKIEEFEACLNFIKRKEEK